MPGCLRDLRRGRRHCLLVAWQRICLCSKATTPGACTDKWPVGSVYKSETCGSTGFLKVFRLLDAFHSGHLWF